jgi:hypothetical protein
MHNKKQDIFLPLSVIPLVALLGLFFFLSGCLGGKQEAYPVPDNIHKAPVQRQEFVGLFLRGWWGEAEAVFRLSVENFLSQDDFCSAARNYVLAHRLLRYAGYENPDLLQKARDMENTGQRCPDVLDEDGDPVSAPKSRELNARLNDVQRMYDFLKKEEDPLYASVYARKAAKRAVDKGLEDLAARFLHLAREVDGRQGWVVFLVRDWQGLLSLQENEKKKQEIKNRIDYLRSLISPGEEIFENQNSG